MRHEWMPGHNFSPSTAHANHQYDANCAVCRGDVARILDVALGEMGSEPLSQRCHDCYEFGHEACGCGECGAAYCGRSDESPQEVTYQEALLEGADPDEGFYE